MSDPAASRARPAAWRDAPARVFLLLAVPAGLLSAALFSPFSIPDEPSHFYRVVAISRGDFTPAARPDGLGSGLPSSYPALVASVAPGLPHQHAIAPRVIREAFDLPAADGALEFVDYRTASQVTVVPYLPAAGGAWAGRILGLPPLAQFYLARLAALAFATWLTWFAIRQMPAYRWLLALLALTPMILSLRASVSADAATTAVAFVLTATLARLAWVDAGRVSNRDWWIAALAAVALCLTKPVYFPLALAAAWIPARRWPGGRKRPLLALYLLAVAAALAVAGRVAAQVEVPLRFGIPVDRAAQVQVVLAEPVRVAGVLVADYFRHAARYGTQLLGKQLGWLDLPLPTALMVAYLAAIGLLWWHDGDPLSSPRPAERLGLGSLLLAILALVSISQYATFTPTGAGYVEGMQGRYFLPAVPIALLAFHRRPTATPLLRPAHIPWLVLAVAIGGFAVAVAAALERYWIVGS